MRNLFLLFFPMLMLAFAAQSQNDYVKRDARVDQLIELHRQINQSDSLVPGFRVQIYFESGNYSKDKAMEIAEEFAQKYPNINYYLSFDEPYYRVRVGDFRSLIEAKGFLQKIIGDYPAAFEVKDMIYFPPLPD